MLASLSYDTTDESLNTVWIGGYESYDSIWWWTDETQWQFSNWAPGEPDDMNYYEVMSKYVQKLVAYLIRVCKVIILKICIF